jgi:putative hydroxymethylpyrimidine transporter CytX
MSAHVAIDARPDSATAEAPLVLDTAPPRPLGFRDQFAFWANLGVSILGFSTAAYFLTPTGYPRMPIVAATLAIVIGTLLGTAMVAIAGVPGATSGAPAMALLRGLFGTKISYLPTVLNVVQCIGWGTYELTVIALGGQALTQHLTDGHSSGPRWLYVVIAGVLTTAMSLRPLGMLRILRRYVTIAVGVAMVYFTVQLLREGLPSLTAGSWKGFLPAVDLSVALAVSWVPLASDYTRHSRSAGSAFWGTIAGYASTGIWCSVLGVLFVARGAGDSAFGPLLAISAGWVFFAILLVREVDQSFANVYSTAMSLQNLLPRVDRRILCLVIGALVTVAGVLIHDFSTYETFLGLIGSVFIPLLGVLAVDWFLGRGRTTWDLGEYAPSRWLMLLPWALGFVTYQLINPGSVQWWADAWAKVQDATHIHAQSWTSASLFAFVVSGLVTWAVLPFDRRVSTR